jgi:uncharacterized repeat protein (TIGR03803 family)
LYGTTLEGGTYDQGTVFKLDSNGNETVLHNFDGILDGAWPYGGVVRDASGNLYGTTYLGGNGGCGVVFKIDALSKETILHRFAGGSDGCHAWARLTRDSLGRFYGTTTYGGPHDAGVVYTVDPAGNEKVLYAFTGGADGARPFSSVTRDSDGHLYGTASLGGKYGFGAVYKLNPSGKETVLYSFRNDTDGTGLQAGGVVRDASGNLYGTSDGGGRGGYGVAYKLDASGNFTVLHAFTGGRDGGWPTGLVLDSAGNLYGTAWYDGNPYCGMGVVYKIGLAGQGSVIYRFTGGADGEAPQAGVIVR